MMRWMKTKVSLYIFGLWLLWHYEVFLAKIRKPPDRMNSIVAQRERWTVQHGKDLAEVIICLIAMDVTTWMKIIKLIGLKPVSKTIMEVAANGVLRGIISLTSLATEFKVEGIVEDMVVLVCMMIAIIVCIKATGKSQDNKLVPCCSCRGCSCGLDEKFDTLQDFEVHPSLLSDEDFCQMVGTFPNPKACCAVNGDTSTNIEAAISSALRSMPHEGKRAMILTFDTGASRTSTGNKNDFVELTEESSEAKLDGIAEGLKIAGAGYVEYCLKSDEGIEIVLRLKAYYVPDLDSSTRLISPQGIRTREGHKGSFVAHTNDDDPDSFSELLIKKDEPGWQRKAPLQTVTINYHPRTNLPVQAATSPAAEAKCAKALNAALCLTEKSNKNLTEAQKELLRRHMKLGHIGFKHLQWMIRAEKVPCMNPHAVGNCNTKDLKCAACEFGKATKRPTGTTTVTRDKDKECELKKGDLFPGQRVSVDHYQSAQPGRLYKSRGGTNAKDMFCGGAIFSDHSSGYVDIRHQVALSAAETVKAKLRYERDAFTNGVAIQAYHTDNGVFTSNDFMEELLKSKQQIRFSGSGAAHQNGVAERAIQTVVNMARTMMLHAAMRSPEGMMTADLWPMAMDHAVWLYNRIPKMDTGLAPIELWTRSTFLPTKDMLSNCHTFGCPVYVLEPKLQKSGIKIPKWAPRSRRGLNMGFSRMHSTLIGLVLNLTTHSITPQFHLVYDDMFTTVYSDGNQAPESWTTLITTRQSRLQVQLDEDANPELADEWLEADERTARDQVRRDAAVRRGRIAPIPTAAPRTEETMEI